MQDIIDCRGWMNSKKMAMGEMRHKKKNSARHGKGRCTQQMMAAATEIGGRRMDKTRRPTTDKEEFKRGDNKNGCMM